MFAVPRWWFGGIILQSLSNVLLMPQVLCKIWMLVSMSMLFMLYFIKKVCLFFLVTENSCVCARLLLQVWGSFPVGQWLLSGGSFRPRQNNQQRRHKEDSPISPDHWKRWRHCVGVQRTSLQVYPHNNCELQGFIFGGFFWLFFTVGIYAAF